MFSLSAQRINRDALIASLEEARAGALVTFEGRVRNHNQGKQVSSLEYQVYAVLAEKEGARILEEARAKFNLHRAVCVHRHGHLPIGETAVWIGAVASHRDDAFRAARYIIDEIKLRLPIWKKEHYLDQAPEWVYCRDHATHVHFDEPEYYQKQTQVVVQNRFKQAKVLVIGAGGLGCPALTSLATAGVGRITIVDHDRVALSNLHRQPLFSVADVGEKKAVIAKNRLAALNPFIEVAAVVTRFDGRNAAELIADHSLVLDCTDNLETKFAIHDACFAARVPLVSASAYRFEGQLRTFQPRNPAGCLRCTYPETPEDAQLGNCNDFGVLGASVAVIGSLQAHEALWLLQQGTNSTIQSTLYLQLQTLTQRRLKHFRRPDCSTCASAGDRSGLKIGIKQTNGQYPGSHDLEIDAQDIDSQSELIDIREAPDAYLDRFNEVRPASKKIIIYCHRGIRSRKLVEKKRAEGFQHFYSLRGGACSL